MYKRQPGDSGSEMRDAGISPASVGDDLGNIEDEAEDDTPTADGGAGDAPSTVTGDEVGAPATTDQTV